MIKLFMIIGMLLMNTSMAFAGDLFTPNTDNWVVKILGKIFGSGLYPGGGTSPLSAPMQTFNEGILLLGGVYACYTLITGILGTAHEGEVLGKKISSVWVPIRYAISTAMIIPVASGYCLAQIVIAWLSIQGNGLADSMWKSYTSVGNSAVIATAGEEFPGVKDLVWNTYQSFGCLHALKGEVAQVDEVLFSGTDRKSILAVTSESKADAVYYNIGDKSEKFFSKDACGTIRMPLLKVPTISTSSTVDQALIIDFDSAPALNAQVQTAQKTAFEALLSKVDTLASQTISSNTAIDPALIEAVITQYQDTLAQVSTSAVASINGLSTLSKNAQKGGWPTAYTYFMQYGYLHDQIATALHNIPTADGPKNAGKEKLSANFSSAIKPVLDTVTNGGYMPSFGGYNNQTSEHDGDSSSFISTVKGYLNKLKPAEIMKQVFLDKMEKFKAKDGEFPIYTMSRMGDTMLVSATAGITAAGVALATLGAHPGIAALIQVLITIILVPMLATGFLLKWFLPFLPFIIGIGVIGGIIFGTAVSILLAPIWVLGHLNPHADSLIGSSGNGYRVMLAMTLRPALTTFGVMISFLIILEMGKYITQAMAVGLALSQSGSGFFTYAMNYIAGPVIYCILLYKMIMNTLPLSHKMADEVFAVIGGGGASPGSYSDAMSHHDNHGAAAGAAAGFAGGAAGALGARGLQNNQPEIKDPVKDPKSGLKLPAGGLNNGGSSGGGDSGASSEYNGKGAGKVSFSEDQLKNSDLAKVISGQAPVMMNQNQTAIDSKLDSMYSVLGDGSQEKMKESVADSINKDGTASDDTHLNNGFKTALNNEFGFGAGSVIKSAGKGGFDSQESKDLAQLYKQTKADMKSASPYSSEKDIVSALSKATAQARSEFETNKSSSMHTTGGQTLNDFVKQSFEKNLNLQGDKDF